MIRPAETAADLDAYARVWSEIFPHRPISGEEVQRRLAEWDDGRHYFVAEADGVVVGTGFASRTSTRGQTQAVVAVLPDHRRRGVGSALLDASVEHGRSLGASSIAGSLSEEELVWAERRGFEEFDRAVEFVLELTGAVERSALPDAVEIGELREHELEDTHWANVATRRLNESCGYRALPPLVEVRKEPS